MANLGNMANRNILRGVTNTGRNPGRFVLMLLVVLGWARDGLKGDDKVSTPEGIVLKEAVAPGSSARVQIELKANGLFQPGLPPDQIQEGAKLPKPLDLDVKTRLIFAERILDVDSEAKDKDSKEGAKPGKGRPRGSIRLVGQAAAAINGEVRRSAAVLRPDVSLLVARLSEGGKSEGVVVASPGGPLTRSELELVQGVADSLTMADLLPGGSVGVGAKWKLGEAAARSLTGYDAITANTLEGVLESVEENTAKVKIQGKVEGSVLGGAGSITCEGSFTFDQKVGWVDHLELNRNESRRPGPIEAGLEVKSTLTLTRQAIATPPELSDTAIEGVDRKLGPERLLLSLNAPNGKAVLLHDRSWHTTWDDPRVVVLKRVDGGKVDAQCNVAVGPEAGKGKHQDLTQFRDDVRRALGKRFAEFIGMGEVDGDPAGNFRYRIGVRGQEGEVGLLWFYYLIASPEGDQLLATFTVLQDRAQAFADQDLALIGSLRWVEPKGK